VTTISFKDPNRALPAGTTIPFTRTFHDDFQAGLDFNVWKTSYPWFNPNLFTDINGDLGRNNSGEEQIYSIPNVAYAGSNPPFYDANPFATGPSGLTITATVIPDATIAQQKAIIEANTGKTMKKGYWGAKYMSGLLTTELSFSNIKYGYFESKMLLPMNTPGSWPAFWLIRTPTPPDPATPWVNGNPLFSKVELDIMEAIGSNQAAANPPPSIPTSYYKYFFTPHWGTNPKKGGIGFKSDIGVEIANPVPITNPPIDMNVWHTMGMIWTPDYIVAVFDGIVLDGNYKGDNPAAAIYKDTYVRKVSQAGYNFDSNPDYYTSSAGPQFGNVYQIHDEAMFLAINLAVGGAFPDAVQHPDPNFYQPNAAAPAGVMYVQYVDAYSIGGSGGTSVDVNASGVNGVGAVGAVGNTSISVDVSGVAGTGSVGTPYGWALIPTSQTATWAQIDTSQTPGWG